MQEQPHPESLRTKKSVLCVMLSIIIVFLSMVTYNTCSELDEKISALNDTLEKLAHSKIDRCNNTYNYICQNFPRNNLNDEEVNQDQLITIYNESIRSEDGKLVNFAKHLFQSCIDETAINDDGWDTLWLIFSDLGGWPWPYNGTGIHKRTWDSTKFNSFDPDDDLNIFKYKDIISKLRKLGIPPILLELSVIPRPNATNRPFHQLSIIANDYFKEGIEGGKMINLVKQFMNTTEDSKIREAYALAVTFSKKLQQFKTEQYGIWTVENYARDWYPSAPDAILQLLNAISGAVGKVIYNTEIQLNFPPREKLRSFFELLRNYDERVVANYIMWTVLYELAPYLHEKVRNELAITNQDRTVWCLAEVEKRFELSPISCVADNTYFTPEFRKEINQYIHSLKSMFKSAVETNRYLKVYEKEYFINETNKVKVEIARPWQYYNISTVETAVSYELAVEPPQIFYNKKNGFLTRILHANRNYDAAMYFKGSEQGNVRFDLEYLKNGHITYIKDSAFLYVPRVVIQRLYDKHLPKYFNLARLGTEIFSYLFNRFAEYVEHDSANIYSRMQDCLDFGIHDYTQADPYEKKYKYQDEYRPSIAQDFEKQFFAGQVARASFDSNNTLPINAKYSPEKIFWFAMASTLCPRDRNADKYLSEMKFYLTLGTNTMFTKESLDKCENNSKIYKLQNAMIKYCTARGKILEF